MIRLGDCGSHVAANDVGENERPLSDLQIVSIVQFPKQEAAKPKFSDHGVCPRGEKPKVIHGWYCTAG